MRIFMRILALNLSTAHASNACVQGDRRQLQIAFFNCICNAICEAQKNKCETQSDKERMNGNNADAIKSVFKNKLPMVLFSTGVQKRSV